MDKWKAVSIGQEIFKGYEQEIRQYILEHDFWFSMTEKELRDYLIDNKDYLIVNQLPEY